MDRAETTDNARKSSARWDRRAVSEVLSYTFIFGLIVASIAIVSVGGMVGLENVRTNEQLSNAERAFDVLHDNLRAVHSEGAPSRATEVSLGDSQMFFGDNITMTVDISSGQFSTEIRPIVFRVDGERRLVYEAGAVIRQDRGGGVVLNDPPFTFVQNSDTQVRVPIVQTTAPEQESIGSTKILVRGQSVHRDVLNSTVDGGLTLNRLEIDSPRNDAWANYFQEQDYCTTVDITGTTVECEIHPDFTTPAQLYVTEQSIRIELIN
jgi:hypothetical protein